MARIEKALGIQPPAHSVEVGHRATNQPTDLSSSLPQTEQLRVAISRIFALNSSARVLVTACRTYNQPFVSQPDNSADYRLANTLDKHDNDLNVKNSVIGDY